MHVSIWEVEMAATVAGTLTIAWDKKRIAQHFTQVQSLKTETHHMVTCCVPASNDFTEMSIMETNWIESLKLAS